SITATTNFRKRAFGLKNQFLRVMYTSFRLSNVQIQYTDSTFTENIFLPEAAYDGENFSALLVNQKSDDSTVLTGAVLKKNKSYQFTLQDIGKKNAYLPFLDREHGLQCRFQSVTANIAFDDTRGAFQISTNCEARNFEINHWRIAKEDVVVPHARLSAMWHIHDDAIELDSTSSFTLGQIPVQLFSSYSIAPDTTFVLNVRVAETVSDTFFNSLPKGMFSTLKGISCSGILNYQLDFFINTQQPDSLIFSSSLTRKNFWLNHYGAENYGRINTPFTYDAYDIDRLVRKIVIGPENPYFTPIDRINPYLTKSVLQSEDPSFMQHRGFLPEAFRESVIENYKEKRFARGGSTISMQLVKNVFLSRDKTISRKVEEALIVYLIENLGLVSKERMLEVYLNVIEWGPDVYGIGEASRFYFSKKPAELTLQESIFLASIIPAPKYFRYRFDKEGNLRPSIEGYFRTLCSRMAGKGWLTTADTMGLLPHVQLKGPARNFVLPADSVEIKEEEDF
ncbi:MAG: biosynthetic peptidoglycan transglycosylase, partial [Bacteroidota bacterium]